VPLRRRQSGRSVGLSSLLAGIAAACVAGCATEPASPPPTPPATAAAFDLVDLDVVNRRLGGELTSILHLDSASSAAVVMLPFANDLGRVADAADPPDTLASHDLFLLSDGVDAASPTRSVLRAYQAVIQSARCLPWAGRAPVGCRLLEGAKQLYESTPDRAPPYARPDFPAWKIVTAAPQAWASPDISWSSAALDVEDYRITMENLFVTLHRPWMSDAFLLADDWYLVGACKGAVSDGEHDNDADRRELLPQVPVGMLLARNFRLTSAQDSTQAPFLEWRAPRLIAWVYRRQPIAPLHSDPCRTDCADHAAGACNPAR